VEKGNTFTIPPRPPLLSPPPAFIICYLYTDVVHIDFNSCSTVVPYNRDPYTARRSKALATPPLQVTA
jgi:hypothetical protein